MSLAGESLFAESGDGGTVTAEHEEIAVFTLWWELFKRRVDSLGRFVHFRHEVDTLARCAPNPVTLVTHET